MLLRDTLHTALRGVTTNVSRSLLTMLGIIIGVGSVVLMSSIGASMQGVILSQISSLGANSMVIFPGTQEGGPNGVTSGHDSLTFEDLNELQKLKTIKDLAPIIYVQGTASYGTQETSPQVLGVTDNYFRNQTIVASHGRLIDATDIEGAQSVAVLGSDERDKLFGQIDPLGKRVKVGDSHFTVVGVAKPLGSQFFQNADDRIYIPYTLAKEISGQKFINFITLTSVGDADLATEDIKSLLRLRHGIKNPKDDPKKDDFVVRTSAQATQILGAVSMGLTMFITTIAAISLVVGGIGIMNIMIVSVTERTREIGLRKAVGATARVILIQFLAESVFLTMIGGCIGALLGVGLAFFAAAVVHLLLSTYTFVVSVPSLIAAFLMAAATGIIFGIAPARKAAQLHPIEALRYE